MNSGPKIESSEYTDLNRVIGWFIGLRWVAAAGVFSALLFVRFVSGWSLPYRTLLVLNGTLFAVNLGFQAYHSWFHRNNPPRRMIGPLFHIQICADYLLLFLLLYYTGFLSNPFSYFFIFHAMLTSSIFPRRTVFGYTAAVAGIVVLVTVGQIRGILPFHPLFPDSGASLSPANAGPGLAGFLSTLFITAYLATSLKRRIEERGRSVEVELNRYKSLDKIKSNFILQVTHELRGPFAALKGFHEMVLKGITGESNPATLEILRKADHRTRNILNIIDEMIDFAYMKSEQGRNYSRSPVYLKRILENNIGIYGPFARIRDITLSGQCPSDLTITSNADLLNIILGNLITNAVKYSLKGGEVLVNMSEEAGGVHLLVRDGGIGIEPEEMDKIFEEFYRTRRARELERDGTGLGLPIVQRAVETLSGRLTVYSEVGKGTSFHVFFPGPARTPGG